MGSPVRSGQGNPHGEGTLAGPDGATSSSPLPGGGTQTGGDTQGSGGTQSGSGTQSGQGNPHGEGTSTGAAGGSNS